MQTQNFEQDAARLIAEAIGADIKGAQKGAAEFDRKQATQLERESKPPSPPQENWALDLYRAFEKINLEYLKDRTQEIALFRRIAEQFPELADLANEMIGHFQVMIEYDMEKAEHDSKRLAELTTV